MEQLTQQMVEQEWVLFDAVQNRGGRASCQDDKTTFFIMRGSQLDCWNEATRLSYWHDLQQAVQQNRNPLAEKYGYMMARTNPAEYAQIEHQLPARSAEKDAMILQICQVHVAWLQELSAHYPALTGRGRGITQESDSMYTTSFETYLWGELATYSMQTLVAYWAYVQYLQQIGENLNRMILKKTVAQYGYQTLEQAEIANGR